MPPDAYIAMPFRTKTGSDGRLIDFNRVYAEFLKLARRTGQVTWIDMRAL